MTSVTRAARYTRHVPDRYRSLMSPRQPAVLDAQALALLSTARDVITEHVEVSHQADALRVQRDRLVRQLVESGVSLGRIAAELEVSKGLVAAIARAADQEVPDPQWPSWAPNGPQRGK